MATPSPQPSPNAPPTSSPTLFTALESHPYSTDYEYQSGLAAILGTTSPPAHGISQHLSADHHPMHRIHATPANRDLHLRARCFYFARKHPELVGPGGVDFDEYVSWRNSQPEAALNPLELTNPAPLPGSASVSEQNTPEKPREGASGVSAAVGESEKSGMDGMGAAIGGGNTAQVNGTPTPKRTQHAPPPGLADMSTTDGDATGPTASFQEVMQLIKEGKPIPGIKEIPDTVLEGQGTPATGTQRKKPWEREGSDGGGIALAWLGGRGGGAREMVDGGEAMS